MRRYIVFFGKRFMEFLTKISPAFSCKVLFFMRTRKIPNLKQPKTFNEKTTWLKLNEYKDNKLVIKCCDKYEVREYIQEKGYESILNDLYGVYNNFDEINFDKIPNRFALKCVHGCAYNIICNDKNNFDVDKSRKKVNRWMQEEYGYATTELQYTKVKPKIIIEKYLCDKDGKMPIDYKFYCFNGKVKSILVCSEREENLRLNYYDIKWKPQNFVKNNWKNKKEIKKPTKLKEMIKISEDLSKEFQFVRVDLYNDGDKIIFGELTFTPACCCAPYYNDEGNISLGDMLELEV